MTIRRYEGAPAPVARKTVVKRVVAKRPAVPRPTRRYEGATLPLAPVKPRAKAPTGKPTAMRPPAPNRRYEAGPTPRRLAPAAAANNARRAGSAGTPWSTGKMFNPTALLDPSQVEDLRNARGRVRARHFYVRPFPGRTEGVIPARPIGRKPARRIGKTRAI